MYRSEYPPYLPTMTSLGTQNRTQGAIAVGKGGFRTGGGSLNRIYNYCHKNQSSNAVYCALGFTNKGIHK